MTSNVNESEAPSPGFRRKLRQATLILPNGRRVKRNITFGPSASPNNANGDAPSDERAPLLGGHAQRRHRRRSTLESTIDSLRDALIRAWTFANSETGRGIFKCSIAYLIGSMGTFVPGLAAMLGQQGGKHMVATITVYFHPARSIGSMFEAMICAVVAFAYAVFVCFSSMGVSIFFGRTLDLIVTGHILVLIVFCGGGLGFVGWVKQHLDNPLVNISCSLTSLAIITVLTKEGAVQAAEFSDEKVVQVMKMILMGVAATTAVSFLVWPVSASKELHEDLIEITDSFGDLLTIITKGFLTGSENELQARSFQDASAKHKKVNSSLTKNLRESKFELYVLGRERELKLTSDLVDCLQRLGQNIGGLRSAATTQFLLLAQPEIQSMNHQSGIPRKQSMNSSNILSTGHGSPLENHAVLEAIDERPEIGSPVPPHKNEFLDENGHLPPVNTPSDIFSRFIVQLGPSMKSLAVTLRKILDELPYGQDGTIAVNVHFMSSLEEAIKLYAQSRQEALQLLYKNKDVSKTRPLEIQADFEEVAASCGYFSFSLQDFANEMKVYLELLDALKLEVEERPGSRSWSWIKVWRCARRQPHVPESSDQGSQVVLFADDGWLDSVSNAIHHKMSFVSLKGPKTGSRTYRYRLWLALGFFRRDDIKFAIKVGTGAALFALPSFLASSRPVYQHWRGEWGLLSYMLVCAMTLGASNTTGLARFFGTCLGAVCAVVAWVVSQGNVFLMAFFGWAMSLWTAYIIVAKGKGPMGRFIMLTYNLSALYAYSMSAQEVDGDEDEGGSIPMITEIALHRVVAVLSGCLWGLIITRLIWPISARRKFKDGLSVLWLRMGLIWRRDPLNMLLEGDSPNVYMDLREEFELHRFLARLENLRSSASSEMALRGPFPDAAYARILKSTGGMLDAFHAMNVMIMKNPKASKGEVELLRYTANERAQLCSRICHLFQVLASSMKLEFPLNEALPSIDHTRDRLLAKIFRFRNEEKDSIGASDEDFELLYAYALVTGQLSKEIKDMGKEIEQLFGVLNEESLKLQ